MIHAALAVLLAAAALGEWMEPYSNQIGQGGSGLTMREGQPLLLIVHPQRTFDTSSPGPDGVTRGEPAARAGIVRARDFFASKGWDYFIFMRGTDSYLTEDGAGELPPERTIASQNGEHGLRVVTRDIFIAGGSITNCARNTALDAVKASERWQRGKGVAQPVVYIHVLSDAVYGPDFSAPRGDYRNRTLTANDAFFGENYFWEDRMVRSLSQTRLALTRVAVHDNGRFTRHAQEASEGVQVIWDLMPTSSLASWRPVGDAPRTAVPTSLNLPK